MRIQFSAFQLFAPPQIYKHPAHLIEEKVRLHLATVWYWASIDFISDEPEFSWQIAPAMRQILWRHRKLWE